MSSITKKLITLSVADIIPYDRNIKNHGENVEKIAQSIKRNHYVAPIVIDENNVILAGHGRRYALKHLGHDCVEVLQVTGLTDKQKADLRISDNRVAEFSERNFEHLIDEVNSFSLDEVKIDFPDIVFDTVDLDDNNEDVIPETVPDAQPIVRHGDIFALGPHRLICDDSTNRNNIQTLLQDVDENMKVHCISDPPYGIDYVSKKHGGIQNDDTILDYTKLAEEFTNGYFCMRTGYQVVDKRMRLINNTFNKVTNMIIRHKGGGGMGDAFRNLAQDFEIVLVANRGNFLQGVHRGGAVWWRQQDKKQKHIDNANSNQLKELLTNFNTGQSVRKVKKDKALQYLHPTQKPVAINEKLLENFTSVGDGVLDLFLGSGSNLVACEKTGRVCFGAELDPIFVQKIITRYYRYTKGARKITCVNRKLNLTPLLTQSES